MQIRRLTPEDAAIYRAMRLEGLQNHPEAFGESAHEFDARSVADIAAMIPADPASHKGFILGAFDDNARLAGVVSLSRESFAKRAHKAILWGMYVRPEFRREKLGTQLVNALIAIARAWGDVEQVVLTAATRNQRAVRLYESLGFKSYGREPRALQIEGDHYDQEHMYLVL